MITTPKNDLDRELEEDLRELRYRRLFPGITSEQYENEPSTKVDRMLAIEEVEKTVIAKLSQPK